MRKAILSTAFVLAGSLGTTGCTSPEPSIIYEYDAYEGEAFPNNRAPLVIPATGALFVTNSFSDTISVLDAVKGDVLGTYPAGRDPVSLDGPHHVVVSEASNAVYIGLSYPTEDTGLGPHASHGSSIKPGFAQKLSLDDLSVLGQTRVDNNPGEIVISRNGERVFTSHFDLARALKNPADIDAARATIAMIEAKTMALVNSPAPKRITTCVAPHGMILADPEGNTAYVACYGEDAIGVVNVNQGTVERIPVAANVSGFGNPSFGPYSLALSPDESVLAIGNTVSKDVRFFQLSNKEMLLGQTMTFFSAPFFPAWSDDGSQLVIPLQSPDAVVLMDVATQKEVQYRSFSGNECKLPHVVTRLPNGTYALTCEGDHKGPGKVLWLDPTTLETIHERDVGVYPDALFYYAKSSP
jgi:DNA-binding beta-propeller fold protein YncE